MAPCCREVMRSLLSSPAQGPEALSSMEMLLLLKARANPESRLQQDRLWQLRGSALGTCAALLSPMALSLEATPPPLS